MFLMKVMMIWGR